MVKPMTNTHLPELLIALFAAVVVVLTLRKNTPRPIELLAWAALIWVCFIGVSGVHDKQARELTSAWFWGMTHMIQSLIGLGAVGVRQWMVDNRFLLFDWAILVAGADLLLLAFLRSRRHAEGWRPRVLLRDWMELPPPAQARPAPATVSATDEINRRFNVWAPVATAAALTWTTLFLIWTGDVAAPTVGRRLRKVAVGANGVGRRVASTNWRGVVAKASAEPRRLTDQVIDFADLSKGGRDARTNWQAGGFGDVPRRTPDGGIDSDGTQRDRQDKLAS